MVGDFLKLGSLAFGLEKKEESALASFTEVTIALASFFTVGFTGAVAARARRFAGRGGFEELASDNFLFFTLTSEKGVLSALSCNRGGSKLTFRIVPLWCTGR